MGEKFMMKEDRKEITARSIVELHDKIKLNAKKGWHLAEKPQFQLRVSLTQKPNNVSKAVLTKDVNDIYINQLELIG